MQTKNRAPKPTTTPTQQLLHHQKVSERFVKDLTVDQLQTLIRITVEELLLEFLGDPDKGLTLRAEVKEQLIQQQQQRLAGRRGLSSNELMEELGLD